MAEYPRGSHRPIYGREIIVSMREGVLAAPEVYGRDSDVIEVPLIEGRREINQLYLLAQRRAGRCSDSRHDRRGFGNERRVHVSPKFQLRGERQIAEWIQIRLAGSQDAAELLQNRVRIVTRQQAAIELHHAVVLDGVAGLGIAPDGSNGQRVRAQVLMPIAAVAELDQALDDPAGSKGGVGALMRPR